VGDIDKSIDLVKIYFFELIDHFIRVYFLPKTPPVGGHSLLCRPLTETTVVASAATARPWRVVEASTTAGNK